MKEEVPLYIAIILLSFIISTIAASSVYKKKKNKRISIFSALMINILILGTAFTVSYLINLDTWNAGIGNWEIIYFIIAIPLISWLNAFILLFIKKV